MSDASSSSNIRSPELLSRGDSRLLVVDVQEKLWAAFAGDLPTVKNCRRLVAGAQDLGVPVFATEQYPKGLGRTVSELAPLLQTAAVIEKVRYSAAQDLKWDPPGIDTSRDKVVITGLEAHICVLQTAFDLMALGYRVHVPADAVASRNKLDWKIALRRLSDGGATITTTEAVLFEWCETARTNEFKTISALVKNG